MPGPPPKDPSQRRNTRKPARGEFVALEVVGWQHGDTPAPPPGLLKASRDAWSTWFAAWFAAHWTPDDLPALRQLVRLFDQVERGEFVRATELRFWFDDWGVSPKGQLQRRWKKPEADQPAEPKRPKSGSRARTGVVANLAVVRNIQPNDGDEHDTSA